VNPDEVRFRVLRRDDVPASNPLNLAYRFGLQDTKQEIVAGERQPKVPSSSISPSSERRARIQCTLSLQAASPVVLSVIVSSIDADYSSY